ncbi:hypothetical protein [Nocardiopsis dassonvillei]|uniref:hypothetical protein n=1 Tax=Nocardiopsis dassonvillei TaxID=2014 RepID=UPI000B9D6050|nr:hypothetical protein [Nocardiopsis dassonvillei]ASU60862.1 hypothetical protein CGQ36_26375 [Nocardiopsis dassonvillei]
MSFEPTEPQNGVDPNPFTLIDPDTIPYPLTDVWSLNYAAETLRTGGEDLFGGAEDMSSTWHGVQAHYSAPESETLFAAMDPVVTRGEGIQGDLATVASALEDLAEAATTARGSLNTLRIDAQSLWNANHDKKVWWLNKDDETDEWALAENIRIKDAVNTAWSTFNEAENACATRISAVFGGPAYVSPDQAAGDGALVYGLPTDAGERDLSLENALSFEGVNSNINDFTAWAGSEFHPSLMDWGNPIGQALWDTGATDLLWGSAVGLTSKLGFWHPDNGWRFDPRGRWDNATAAWSDAWMDTVTLVGVHDEHGWLWEPGEGGQEGWGAGWDRWTGNAWGSLTEIWEGHTAWSTRDDGVAYSNTTIGANAALMTVGLPLKALKIIAGAGVVSSMDAPGGPGDAEFDGSGSGSGGGSGSGSDSFTSRGGAGTRGWPSSPLPGAGEGQRPTGERFENPLTMLNNSLLDPDRYRPPASTPTTPVPDGGGDRPSQNPPAPQPQDSGTTPNYPRDDDSLDHFSEDVHNGAHLERENWPETTTGSSDELGTSASYTRPDTELQRGNNQGSASPVVDADLTIGTGDLREERIAVNPDDENVDLGMHSEGGASRSAYGSGADGIADDASDSSMNADPRSGLEFDSDANNTPLDGHRDHSGLVGGESDDFTLESRIDFPSDISGDMPREILVEIDEAIELVGQVHRFPAAMETVTFELRELGAGRAGRYEPGSRTILLNPVNPNLRETLVHEIGHAIDHAITGSPRRLASIMPSTPALRAWASTVRSSPQYKALYAEPSTDYVDYMIGQPELFARSYAQWVAERTGDRRLQEEIRSHLDRGGVDQYRQWRDDDFRPIAQALDEVFANDWNLR